MPFGPTTSRSAASNGFCQNEPEAVVPDKLGSVVDKNVEPPVLVGDSCKQRRDSSIIRIIHCDGDSASAAFVTAAMSATGQSTGDSVPLVLRPVKQTVAPDLTQSNCNALADAPAGTRIESDQSARGA